MNEEAAITKYEYKVTQPRLPPDATSPVMDYRQMTDWLNSMGGDGWELVTYGATHWHNNPTPQQWWIFRREIKGRR